MGFNLYRSSTTGELAVGVVTLKALRRSAELLADYGTKFWRTPELKPVRSSAMAALSVPPPSLPS